MNPHEQEAKSALDSIIRKSRVHLYKPIQIAEILYIARNYPDQINIQDLSTYRTQSRQWRDKITRRLLGNVSTSSARYQDDIFNPHAMPIDKLATLMNINNVGEGVVENYIYQHFKKRQEQVLIAYNYLQQSTIQDFSVNKFIGLFESHSGLRRSIDKLYEIIAYALLSVLIDELDVRVSIQIGQSNSPLIASFESLLRMMFGFIPLFDEPPIYKARIFRHGVTNAADSGLDMWANFGVAIQVKHVTLTEELASDIMDKVRAEHILVVCQTIEAPLISSILNQLGIRIKGIITQADIEGAYNLAFQNYADTMGQSLLNYLFVEFRSEFQHVVQLDDFLLERNYDEGTLSREWRIETD